MSSEKSQTPAPDLIASHFVAKYYTKLTKHQEKLHHFYCSESHFVHSEGPNEPVAVYGLGDIRDFIASQRMVPKAPQGVDMSVDMSTLTVDAQQSQSDGVVLLVTGVMRFTPHTHNGAAEEGVAAYSRVFVQNFYLAPRAGEANTNYYVINDTFRFLDIPAELFTATPNHTNANTQTNAKLPKESATPPKAQQPAPTTAPTATNAEQKGVVTAAPEVSPEVTNASPEDVQSSDSGGPVTWAQMAARNNANAQNTQSAQPRAQRSNGGASKQGGDSKATNGGHTSATEQDSPTDGKAQNTIIYVKGLTAAITEQHLRETFGGHGEIKAVAMRDGKGFAFIEFATPDQAAKALQAPQVACQGETLTVELKTSKGPMGGRVASKRRSRGGGKGGGDGSGGAGEKSRSRGGGGRNRRKPSTTD